MRIMKKLFIAIIILITINAYTYSQDISNNPPVPGFNDILKMILVKSLGVSDYMVTPGDVYEIFITMTNPRDFNNISQTFTLVLSNKYELEIPYIGVISASGMTYHSLRELVLKKIKEKITVQFIEFKLSAPGVFEVFVYGAVKTSIFANATSFSRITDLLLQVGLMSTSSFRNIQLFRGGKTITLDLIKYLNRGDLAQNPQLEPGDKIFIPFQRFFCEIKGAVLKPGMYELVEGETLADMLTLCGGILPVALSEKIQVMSIAAKADTTVEFLDMQSAASYKMKTGDIVQIKSKLENKGTLLVEGAFYDKPYNGTGVQLIPVVPAVFNLPYLKEYTLLSVLELIGGPTPYAQFEKSVIIRNGETIPIDVKTLWDKRDRVYDVKLEAYDHIIVPIQNLNVAISGYVYRPGVFPFASNKTVGDYLRLAGGLVVNAGDPGRIYKVEPSGKKIKSNFTDIVSPGTLLFVDRNNWIVIGEVVSQAEVITTFLTAVITLTTAIIALFN